MGLLTGIVLLIVVVVVLSVVLRATDAAVRPFEDALDRWEKRTIEALADRYSGTVELAVPLQVGGALLALVLLILLVSGTTGGAAFILLILGLFPAGFAFKLGRRLSKPAPRIGRPPSARVQRPPARARVNDVAASLSPPAPATAPLGGSAPPTYTSSPPTPDDVRRRIRIAELRQAPSLTADAQAELDLLLSIDARRA